MTIDQMAEICDELSQNGHGEKELMILDGFNGGGVPRDINIEPKKTHHH